MYLATEALEILTPSLSGSLWMRDAQNRESAVAAGPALPGQGRIVSIMFRAENVTDLPFAHNS
jgi:hypothetical protein